MNFYRRGLRYLWRKRGKSGLLLLILFISSSMVLGTTMILQSAKDTKRAIYEKTGTKLVLEARAQSRLLSDNDVQAFSQDAAITDINRQAEAAGLPGNFSLVTSSDDAGAENRQATLHACDDTARDGPFAQGRYQLLSGAYIEKTSANAVMINALLAAANGLELGSTVQLTTPDGVHATATVVGIFFSGTEREQDAATAAMRRLENQIFVSFDLFATLYPTAQYTTLCLYTASPDALDALAATAENHVGEFADITTSDALYQQLKAPLEQAIQIARLMLFMTVATTMVVVSLLLCMWMRTRQTEFAVLIGMGYTKSGIFLQALWETALLFFLSCAAATACAAAFAGQIQSLFFSGQEFGGALCVGLAPGSVLALLGFGSAMMLLAIAISLLPTFKAAPKDILSKMEG